MKRKREWAYGDRKGPEGGGSQGKSDEEEPRLKTAVEGLGRLHTLQRT